MPRAGLGFQHMVAPARGRGRGCCLAERVLSFPSCFTSGFFSSLASSLRRIRAPCFPYSLLGLKTNGLQWPGGSLRQTAPLARSQQGEALPGLGGFGLERPQRFLKAPSGPPPCVGLLPPRFLRAVAGCCCFSQGWWLCKATVLADALPYPRNSSSCRPGPA